MRNKMVVWGYLIVLSLGTILSLYMPKTEAVARESIVIPGEAIRLRILANSDFESDQNIKRKVRDAVNAQITLWVQDLTSMEKARTVIKAKLPEIEAIATKVVREQGENQSVKVEFGQVQFPTKLYGQFLYPAGEYQAVLITLGSGEGANWWCVLYPPLCFLDFSNGVAVSAGFDEEEKVKSATVSEGEEVVAKAEAETIVAKKETKTASVEEADVVKKEVGTVSAEEAVVESVKEDVATDVEGLVANKNSTDKVTEAGAEVVDKPKKHSKKVAPVYTTEDEQPVKVKFFVVELWDCVFN
jgi:stage II sporulation protein R